MQVSYQWLQKHIKEPLPTAAELVETIIFHAFEVESVVSSGKDTILDIKVLPDRAGDCLSHAGIAREIAGLLGLTFVKEEQSIEKPELTLPIELQSDLVRRYIAIEMHGIKVGPSPSWLKEALEAVGQRSINNVVDATNFVMLDSGQPIHAFDRAKIDGGIVVRTVKSGEKITMLSGEEKELSEKNLVIADYLGALALAGVKGGKVAEVSDATTDIIIEVANFDAVSVRKTSRSLGLITDASKRFENNFSPEGAASAAAQVVTLLTELTGGTISGYKDVYPKPEEARKISFTVEDIIKTLGISATLATIEKVLSAYGYSYELEGNTITLTVPFWRADLQGIHDIAEEVGRVIGYESIEAQALPFTPVSESNEIYEQIRAVKQYLQSQGYSEIMTYTFRKKGELYISYGAKDKSALRTNLSEAMKESYELNRLNAPLLGMKSVSMFEVGTVFTQAGEAIHVATCDGGVIQETALKDFFAEKQLTVNANYMRLQNTEKLFSVWSPYPFITRDIAVWVDKSVDNTVEKKRLEEIIFDFAKEHCARDPYVIDEFTKDGRLSIAFRLVFQGSNKTLTEGEVKEWFDLLLKQIEKARGFEVR